MRENTTGRERVAQMRYQEQSRKKMLEKFDQAWTWKMVKIAVVATAMNIWFAQMIVWGLSLFHVRSGIWGVFLILDPVASALMYAVQIGMMNAVKKTQEISRNL